MYIVYKYLYCGVKVNFIDVDIIFWECMILLLFELYFNVKLWGEKIELYKRFEMRIKWNIRYYLRYFVGVYFGY